MSRIYVAGPMSGYKDHNFPLFNVVSDTLRSLGHEVVNPVELNPDVGTPWEDCMRKDIAALMTCDTVALLPEWEASRGASLEVHVAKAFRMKVVPFGVLISAGGAA